jgi:hypothetical protein
MATAEAPGFPDPNPSPGQKRDKMGPHKYFVGQVVLVGYAKYPDIKKGERFGVARLLPLEGAAPQYRIKSEFDGRASCRRTVSTFRPAIGVMFRVDPGQESQDFTYLGEFAAPAPGLIPLDQSGYNERPLRGNLSRPITVPPTAAIPRETGPSRSRCAQATHVFSLAFTLSETMRDLPCRRIQVDEIWAYVGKKQPGDNRARLGDMWTFVALAAHRRLCAIVAPCAAQLDSARRARPRRCIWPAPAPRPM